MIRWKRDHVLHAACLVVLGTLIITVGLIFTQATQNASAQTLLSTCGNAEEGAAGCSISATDTELVLVACVGTITSSPTFSNTGTGTFQSLGTGEPAGSAVLAMQIYGEYGGVPTGAACTPGDGGYSNTTIYTAVFSGVTLDEGDQITGYQEGSVSVTSAYYSAAATSADEFLVSFWAVQGSSATIQSCPGLTYEGDSNSSPDATVCYGGSTIDESGGTYPTTVTANFSAGPATEVTGITLDFAVADGADYPSGPPDTTTTTDGPPCGSTPDSPCYVVTPTTEPPTYSGISSVGSSITCSWYNIICGFELLFEPSSSAVASLQTAIGTSGLNTVASGLSAIGGSLSSLYGGCATAGTNGGASWYGGAFYGTIGCTLTAYCVADTGAGPPAFLYDGQLNLSNNDNPYFGGPGDLCYWQTQENAVITQVPDWYYLKDLVEVGLVAMTIIGAIRIIFSAFQSGN